MSEDINAKLGNLIQLFSKYMQTTIEPVQIQVQEPVRDQAVPAQQIQLDKQRLLDKVRQFAELVKKNSPKVVG